MDWNRIYGGTFALAIGATAGGGIRVVDSFLFWQTELIIRLDSGRVTLRVTGPFNRKCTNTQLENIHAEITPAVNHRCPGVLAWSARLCIADDKFIVCKAHQKNYVAEYLNEMNRHLQKRLMITDLDLAANQKNKNKML